LCCPAFFGRYWPGARAITNPKPVDEPAAPLGFLHSIARPIRSAIGPDWPASAAEPIRYQAAEWA
jgi:hypothetical protein